MQKNLQKKNSRSTGKIRIISGQWGGRKLTVHEAEGLRPTTDRIKETLFNWLAPYVAQARVLDLFSGAGSLGFEALSRYAQYALLCEKNKLAARQLKQNLSELHCQKSDVTCTDSLAMLDQHCSEGFDIIFIDPPFRQGLAQPCVEKIEKNQWANDQALIYIEVEREHAPIQNNAHWELLKEKIAGQVKFQLWRYHSQA